MRNTILFFVLFLIFNKVQSQIEKNSPFHKNAKCDTINIDKCYITRYYGEKYEIDTNVQEKITGLFEIIEILPLNSFYCLLYAEYQGKSNYDYFVILVEKEDDIIASGTLKIGKSFYMRLRRYYDITQTLKHVSINYSDAIGITENIALTQHCQDRQMIFYHGKREVIVDCPIYTRLYRLEKVPFFGGHKLHKTINKSINPFYGIINSH